MQKNVIGTAVHKWLPGMQAIGKTFWRKCKWSTFRYSSDVTEGKTTECKRVHETEHISE